MLCLAPRHCSREAFFTSFCDILRNHAEIDELFPVPEAYTPVSGVSGWGEGIMAAPCRVCTRCLHVVGNIYCCKCVCRSMMNCRRRRKISRSLANPPRLLLLHRFPASAFPRR